MDKDIAERLRRPFEPHQISIFPRNAGSKAGLSYVGHAALTDRLLQADPCWAWEPVANPASIGLPITGSGAEIWIKLTIGGVTRYGYGDAPNKKGGDAIKEAIGDALRNAAMRFGVALDLWHKGGDLYDGGGHQSPAPEPKPVITQAQLEELRAELQAGGSDEGRFLAYIAKSLKVDSLENITASAFADVLATAQAATKRRKGEA